MLTTTIGSYPKPGYLDIPDWFKAGTATADPTAGYAEAIERLGEGAESLFRKAAAEVIADQVDAGIDIVTDGEVRRENYIHYHCRHLDGIDFGLLTAKTVREGAYEARLPTVTGAIAAREPFLPDDWRAAQASTDRPVKATMPGPLTISDTMANAFYADTKSLCAALAQSLNSEVLALAEAGCRHIQIDEPVFARRTPEALDFGLDCLERAFHRCPSQVMRTVHMCCGYPDHVDDEDYPKAPRESYFELAEAIDRSSVDAVSLEDAHRHNDLTLLERFASTRVILGVVAIARSRVETVEEIGERLRQALDHIDGERLIAAPDCGLGMLGRDLARAKLCNLADAAHSLP